MNTVIKTNKPNGTHNDTGSYLQKFFVEQLRDMYYTEKELISGLEEMKKAASTEELEDAFDAHLKQTERHVQRLEKVFKMISRTPEQRTCEVIDALLRSGRTVISETKDGSLTRDAALIIAAQKIEHHEIAAYGGLVQLAVTMGLNRAADLLDKTLREEEQTDSLLTDIAESFINVKAEQEGSYSWQKQV